MGNRLRLSIKSPLRATRGVLRSTRDRLVGRRRRTVLEEIIARNGERFAQFGAANEYIRFEAIPGDILEFGVFTGLSLALLAKCHSFNETPDLPRRLVGFDSFEGLGRDPDGHSQWAEGDCAVNHGWHPLLPIGARVTPDTTLRLFEACHLPPPEIEVGDFSTVLESTIPSKYTSAALVHIDCDLYPAARAALFGVEPILQDGAMLLFDDWFHYKGDPNRGEARAFREFLEAFPHWEAIHYRGYATFCNSFLLHRR